MNTPPLSSNLLPLNVSLFVVHLKNSPASDHLHDVRSYSPSTFLKGLWFNVDRTVSELLDHLCEFSATFRSEAIDPESRVDAYPVYYLQTPAGLDHPVLKAIMILLRNDTRTNTFVASTIKGSKSFADIFSLTYFLIGKPASRDQRVKDILHPQLVGLSNNEFTSIIIGARLYSPRTLKLYLFHLRLVECWVR